MKKIKNKCCENCNFYWKPTLYRTTYGQCWKDPSFGQPPRVGSTGCCANFEDNGISDNVAFLKREYKYARN